MSVQGKLTVAIRCALTLLDLTSVHVLTVLTNSQMMGKLAMVQTSIPVFLA